MDDLSEKADKLIKDYAFGSSLTGFIPIPFVDMLGLIGVQRIMLMRLSKLYDIPFSQNLAKTWLGTLMGGIAPTATAPMVSSALKIIPGIGTLAGSISMSTMGSAATYAIGKVFQQHFEGGGTLENFEPEKVKETLDEAIKKGKKIIKNNNETV